MLNVPNTYIERMAENVLTASFEDFDQATIENVKNRIIDILGCVISGAYAQGNLALIDLVKGWGGSEEATILVHGGKAPAHNVAMVNSIMARSFDFEPNQARVNGVNIASHISGTTVTTALTLGEAKDINGKELMTALLLGDDFACRVLAASGFGFTRGWDSTGTINAIGATAIAGRLLGLSKRQLLHAFGIVLNQLAGSFEIIWDGTIAFKLPQGLSAKNGIFSAELAKAGWTGPQDALLSKFGYFHLYTDGCSNPEVLIEDLGIKYHTEVTFKLYPCCRANHAAIDCALNVVKENIVDVDEIEEIILKVPSRVGNMFVAQPFMLRDNPQIDAAFSIRFDVANVLLRRDISLEHFQDNFVRDPQIIKIANKIKIGKLENPDPKALGASLKLKMKNGQDYFSKVDFAKGEPILSPLSKESIKEKFINNVSFSQTISKENAEKALNLIENLEDVEKISELIKLLVVNK